MKKVTTMVFVALALAVPALARAQATTRPPQEDKQSRRELEQKMRELQRQMRELERDLAGLAPEPGTVLRVRTPNMQIFSNRAYLGVNVATDQNPATDSIGAVLAGVTPGGPADQAGLKAGDIITLFNAEKLAGRYPAAGEEQSEPGLKLVDFARELDEGDTVRVEYRRAKETRRATIVARDLEPGFAYAFSTPMPKVQVETGPIMEDAMRAVLADWPAFYGSWLGLELVALNPELGEYFGTTEGLLVIRAPEDSLLKLRGGDVILAIDGRKPASQSQLVRILRSYGPGEEVRIDVMRQKRKITVTAKIPERQKRRGGMDWEWNPEPPRP